jgi:hypothetical protein
MSDIPSLTIKQRLKRLEEHLRYENPVLLEVVKSFRQLDKIAYRLGFLDRSESFATQVSWWPLVSILGTFSSGKSTFINDYLDFKLQLTGNQAVDDKFTVLSFSSDHTPRVLPGLALDADPRFAFYQISRDIDSVASGEGRRVDAYLQLKTCPSEKLRGKIIIDSPGFDADAQRTAILRITKHIVDLSDLVLVFFDARHPEPGAMQDTLKHLVVDTIKRPDSAKFMYILNQIDTTAREDNPEEVFGAWQRALASEGLTAGRFYRIYSKNAAAPIADESLRQRFEEKRAVDMKEILSRMHQVEMERAYRVIGMLEKTAKAIATDFAPHLREAKQTWKRRVLWIDSVVYGVLLIGVLGWGASKSWWSNITASPQLIQDWVMTNPVQNGLTIAAIALLVFYPHFAIRALVAKRVGKTLLADSVPPEYRDRLIRAFRRNTRFFMPLLRTSPIGWGNRARRRVARILSDADRYVQALNDLFTNPSGAGVPERPATPVAEIPPPELVVQAQAVPSASPEALPPTPVSAPVTADPSQLMLPPATQGAEGKGTSEELKQEIGIDEVNRAFRDIERHLQTLNARFANSQAQGASSGKASETSGQQQSAPQPVDPT